MKKWKSLFACGLVLLLTGWTMLCIPFNAYAQTWEAESTSTNIVAVVDCSTSMQSSDSDWKIPESLDMLVDMCDDEQVRLSLIVYGTSAETAFRDFPLSAENHVWGDRIFEKCGIRRDEGGDGGKTLEIRGKRRLSARDGGANYQQS